MSDEQQVNDCQAVFDRVRALGHTDPRVHMAFGHLARGMPADQVLVELIKGLSADVETYRNQVKELLAGAPLTMNINVTPEAAQALTQKLSGDRP